MLRYAQHDKNIITKGEGLIYYITFYNKQVWTTAFYCFLILVQPL